MQSIRAFSSLHESLNAKQLGVMARRIHSGLSLAMQSRPFLFVFLVWLWAWKNLLFERNFSGQL
jgi:hypothetical protein